jgi:energy-coupling factor transporter ATP-binding protein EcfA2
MDGKQKMTLPNLVGVTAGYGVGLVLKGVDLKVDEGQIFCLIGPNGAGKSTVLKAISGLLGSWHRSRSTGPQPFPGDDRVGERSEGRTLLLGEQNARFFWVSRMLVLDWLFRTEAQCLKPDELP